MANIKYVVDTFDGVAGESNPFEKIEDAQAYMEKEVKYYKDNGYTYETIELYSWDEDKQEKIDTIDVR